MIKTIIFQGKSLTIKHSGNYSFSVNFLTALSKAVPNIEIRVLVPKAITISELKLNNVKVVILPYSDSTVNSYKPTFVWENNQIANYVHENASSDSIFVSLHHVLPAQKLPIKEFAIIHDILLWIRPDEHWDNDRKQAYQTSMRSIQHADHLFSVSNFTKKELIKHLKLPKTKITPIYQDINPIYKQPTLEHELPKRLKLKPKQYFFYLGSFEPRKNVDFLIKSYHQYYRTSSSPLPLLIVGENIQRSQNRVNIKIDYPGIVHLPTIDALTAKQLYQNATAFIYPSLYEGFGLQVLEAQNSECPLICADIPIFREVSGNAALFFNPQKQADLIQSMLNLVNNSSLANNLVKGGLNNCKKYSWSRTVELFLNKIENFNFLRQSDI